MGQSIPCPECGHVNKHKNPNCTSCGKVLSSSGGNPGNVSLGSGGSKIQKVAKALNGKPKKENTSYVRQRK